MQVRYFRNHWSIPDADTQGKYPLLESYLSGDVQSSPNTCLWLLERIDEIKSGKIFELVSTGNAHTLTLRPNCVLIESEYTEGKEVCTLELDEFEHIIRGWMQFVSP